MPDSTAEVMDRRDTTSIDIESLEKELENINPLSKECCIFRVPDRLRQLNEQAFTPHVVSIGPLHHAGAKLLAMEEQKRRYLQCFLQRKKVKLDSCVRCVKKREERLLNCYAEKSKFESKDFLKMILVDTAFLIELFWRIYRNEDFHIDGIISKPLMLNDVLQDIILLENQLPFFILEDLFDLAYSPPNCDSELSIYKLAYSFCKLVWNFSKTSDYSEENYSKYSKSVHLLDFLRVCHIQPPQLQTKVTLKSFTPLGATKLFQAGVKFEPGSSGNIYAIEFKNRVLKIAAFKMSANTEILFRNLIAFEQLDRPENFVNDYVTLMNLLINTPKDVELLSQYGIIQNLWDTERVSTLFHELYKESTTVQDEFYFAGIVEDLRSYYQAPWHEWKAILKQNYFSNPWAAVSLVAAIVLLMLTFIQTVCSVLQVKVS